MPRQTPSIQFNAPRQQSYKEEKYAFIGTVERFVRWYCKRQQTRFPINEECMHKIFLVQFGRDFSKYKTWGELAEHFSRRIKKGAKIPRRLQYKQHLHDIGEEMSKECDKYFQEIGIFT